jgi:plasmid stabilization system protein ParE
VSRTHRLSEQAEAHVDAIADLIAGDNVDAAVKVVLALEDAFVLLAARPGIGHVREDLTSRPL